MLPSEKMEEIRLSKMTGLYFTLSSHCSVVNFVLGKAKTHLYFCEIIQSEKGKSTLFRTAKSILNIASAPSLLTDDKTDTLPVCFSDFFMDKIDKNRSAIYPDLDIYALNLAKEYLFHDLKNYQPLKNFQPAREGEFQTIVLASSSVCCDLDLIPTPLLKKMF